MFKIKNIFLLASATIALIISCSQPESQTPNSQSPTTISWPIYRGDTNLSGVAKGPLPDNLKLLWTFKTEYEIKSSPVIGGGLVYFGSTDAKLYALNIKDGTEVWSFDAGDDIEAPPLLVDGVVYVGSLSGMFYALDAKTGQVVWTFETDDEIYGSANWVTAPNGTDKWIILGSYDFFVYCLDAKSGKKIWAVETDNYINGAPATDGTYTVFGGCDEQLHIVTVADGVEIAKVDAGSYIAGSAALVDGFAFLGHYGEALLCIDINKKEIVWEYDNNGKAGAFFSTPAVNDKLVVIGSRDKLVHCVDRKTGQQKWTFQTRDDVDSSPVICQEKVVVASMDGRLYILDIKTGSQLWSFEIGADIVGCPAVAGGKIFIGAEDGRLYVFGEAE
jgi:eukaryotic-like serine/threonine-protein kinase